jgi:hypothetical protein
MTKYFGILMLLSFVFMSACGGGSKSGRKAAKASEVPSDFAVSMERTPCFGTCPVYKIEISNTGTLTWTGIRFTEREHIWSRQLNSDEMQLLWQEVQRSGYFEMAVEYDDPSLSDAPSILLEIQGNGKTHKVKDRIRGPEALRQLESMIDTLANQPGLIFVKEAEKE